MASPLDNHLEEVLAARKAGKSFAAIARELADHGVTVGKRGLSAWYRRRQRRMRELRNELEDFGRQDSFPSAATGIAAFPAVAAPAAVQPADDWTVPARSSRIELKVVRSSQES